MLKPGITWQQREQRPEQQRQQPEQRREQQPERKRQQREQQPEREQRREREQQPEQLLLFCHKQPEQQQRSRLPEREICSFDLPSELKNNFRKLSVQKTALTKQNDSSSFCSALDYIEGKQQYGNPLRETPSYSPKVEAGKPGVLLRKHACNSSCNSIRADASRLHTTTLRKGSILCMIQPGLQMALGKSRGSALRH